MKRLSNLPANLSSNNLLIIWIVFFCYSTVVAIIFQKLILPQIPSLHAANGLMNNDAIYFHQVAIKLAESIKEHGWGAWQAWPAVGATGNVSLLAALYVIFGSQPAVIIPVNAALHASSGILLLLLGIKIGGEKKGFVAGLLASTLFIVFPSSLNWYGQLHKDGYVIAGILLIVYVWVRTLNGASGIKAWLYILIGTLSGVFLIGFTRPYLLKILALALLCVWSFNLLTLLFKKNLQRKYSIAGIHLISLVVILVSSVVLKGQSEDTYLNLYETSTSSTSSFPDYKWQEGSVLPVKLEGLIKIAALTRAGMIQYNIAEGADSLIDPEIKPDNVISVIAYLPRALQIGLFAPFPNVWFSKLSIMRLVSVLEMAIWYCFVPGVLLALLRNSNPARWTCLVFALVFLTVFGFVVPNVGTLYRVRYLYLFIILLLGAVGWVDYFAEKLSRHRKFNHHRKSFFGTTDTATLVEPDENSMKNRGNVIGSGGIVVFFTFLSFVGFFIRDVCMARWFGMGAELDIFIIGMMVPMFLVSVISIPLGTAMTPYFIDLQINESHQAAQRFIHALVIAGSLILIVVCLGLYLLSPFFMPVLGWNFSILKTIESSRIMYGFLPILFFSGALIIGNSVLNAMKKFLITGMSQLVVPVAAIGTLYCLGQQTGVFSVVIGMVIGQFFNLLFIEFALRKYDFSLIPKVNVNFKELTQLWGQYLPLAGAGFFMGAAIPINNAMASSLDEGSVATLGIGTKLVIFISGLVGTAITTVMIPYFSGLMAKKEHSEASRELSFFLVLATFVSVPLTLLMFVASSEIVSLVFQGGVLKSGDVAAISRVFKYGILQLPFFTCGMLFMRFATARKRSAVVLFATAIGLLVNILLNSLLMQRMGAPGIALATSISLVASSSLLLMFFLLMRYVSWYSGILLFMSWMLFLTLAFCIHFMSYVGIIVILLAYGLQICGQWKAMHERETVFIAN
jgi:murein biosynthesis integral membrane protein MurJ